MPKMLVLSYGNVSERVTGGAMRVSEILAALADQALLCQPGGPHPLCETVPLRADFGRRKVGINWGIFNFFCPRNAAVVRALVSERRPAGVILTSIWNYHPLAAARDLPLLYDAQNVESVAIGERFGAQHPFARVVRRYERKVVRRMAHVFACSENDRRLLIDLYGLPPGRVSVVPNGVTLDEGQPAEADLRAAQPLLNQLQGKTVLFFMGKLDYQPNREALDFISGDLMPALEQKAAARFRCLICGGPIPHGVAHPSMVFAGRVPSLKPYLGRADLCLAPVFTGSGTRLKVLEYLAARKPVVATDKAVEGLDGRDGTHFAVAEENGFAEKVLALVHDRAAADAMAANGFELVRSRYAWSAIRPGWTEVVKGYTTESSSK